jgi:hypothetical protein
VLLGVIPPASAFAMSFFKDPAGVTLPVFAIDAARVRIPDGVKDPASDCRTTFSAVRAPVGVIDPLRSIAIALVKTPPGVRLPAFVAATAFVAAPVGVKDPPRFWVYCVLVGTSGAIFFGCCGRGGR